MTDVEFPSLYFSFVCMRRSSCPRRLIPSIKSVVDHSLRSATHAVTPGKILSSSAKGLIRKAQYSVFSISFLAAFKVSCEGRTDQFWGCIALASRAAPKAGIHTDTTSIESRVSQKGSAQELDREVRRRVFCSLYVLDRYAKRLT